jgi:hypothetical protein
MFLRNLNNKVFLVDIKGCHKLLPASLEPPCMHSYDNLVTVFSVSDYGIFCVGYFNRHYTLFLLHGIYGMHFAYYKCILYKCDEYYQWLVVINA